MSKRKGLISRKTSETDIKIELTIDGAGKYSIKTGIAFLDHMLSLFSKHGLFDLKVEAKGDLDVDIHHTNEDIGICLGEAVKKALGPKKGIRRYGFSYVPMDEALVRVVLDISNRPKLVINGAEHVPMLVEDNYNFNYAQQFLEAFIMHSGITLHVDIINGVDYHHIIEAVFKALAKALDEATRIDERMKTVPSTKGRL